MRWFQIIPTGNFGYPQPEDSWDLATYGAGYCVRCGIAPMQRRPFRFRNEPTAMHSDFLALNWVHDELFVRPHVVADLAAANITGVDVLPALRHKTGVPLSSLVQLRFLSELAPRAVITDGLQPVTCRPGNEESHVQLEIGASRISTGAPYCGRLKYHPSSQVRLNGDALDGAPELARSAEWFGSGGKAFRLMFASDRVIALAKARKWRGIQWKAVDDGG